MANTLPLISIIIPVYNAEAYLPRCLDSAVNQTFQSIEIIVVDDGSPGNCKEICARYPQVHYLSYGENRGLFRAREYGTRSAQGRYIFNLDSDDWLPPDACKHIAKGIGQSSADILMHGSQRILPKNTLKRKPLSAKPPLLSFFTHIKGNTHIFLWQLVLKREILLRVYDDLAVSDHLVLSEDVLHLYPCLFYAQTWATVPYCCYFYNESNTSASRKTADTQTALKDLAFMKVLFRKLEEFRRLKGLPIDIFASVQKRQFYDRLHEFQLSFKNMDWDLLLPQLIDIFGGSLLSESIFDVLKTPSLLAPLRRPNWAFMKMIHLLFPRGSWQFNILQLLWWKLK